MSAVCSVIFMCQDVQSISILYTCSIDFTCYIPGIGTHTYTVSSPLGRIQRSFKAALTLSQGVSFISFHQVPIILLGGQRHNPSETLYPRSLPVVHDWESNPRPLDPRSNTLTITPRPQMSADIIWNIPHLWLN